MATVVETQIRRDEFDTYGSRRKLTWIPRGHETDHAPNSILCDPPIQRGSGRLRGYGFPESPLGTSGRFRGYGVTESPLGTSGRFRSPGPLESPLGTSGRFRGPSESTLGTSGRFRASAASDPSMGSSGRFRVSGTLENPLGTSGRFRPLGASESPTGASGRYGISGASDFPSGSSGRFRMAGASDSGMGSSGRFRISGASDSPTGSSERFRMSGPSDAPMGSSGRFRISGASDSPSPLGASGRYRVFGASDSPMGSSERFRVNGIPESPGRIGSLAIPESPARRGESVRRIRAPESADSPHDKPLLPTNSTDNDKSRVPINAAGHDKSSLTINSVDHNSSSAPSDSSDCGSARRSAKSKFDHSLLKPGRASHHHLVDTIVESDQTEDRGHDQMKAELEDSGPLSSGEKSTDGSSSSSSFGLSSSGEKSSDSTSTSTSSSFRTRTSFLAEKERSTMPRDNVMQNPRSVSFSAAQTTDHETKSEAILQASKEVHSRPSLLGSPFLVEHPQHPLTLAANGDGWETNWTTSAIMGKYAERRMPNSPARSPSPLGDGDLQPRQEQEIQRERTFRSPPSTETPSQVSSELENPQNSEPTASKVDPMQTLDQKESAGLAKSSEGIDSSNAISKYTRKDQEDVRMAIELELGRRRSFNGFAHVDPADLSILRLHKGNAKSAARSREMGRQLNADAEAESLPKEQQKQMNERTFPKEQQKLMNGGTLSKELQKQLYHQLHPLMPAQGGQLQSTSARTRSGRLAGDSEKPPVIMEDLFNEKPHPLHSKQIPQAAVAHLCRCEAVIHHPVFQSGQHDFNAQTAIVLPGATNATTPVGSKPTAPFSRNSSGKLFSPTVSQEQQQIWNQTPGFHGDQWPADSLQCCPHPVNNVHFSRVETPVSNSRRIHGKILPQREPVNYVRSNSQYFDPNVYRAPAQSHPGADGQPPVQQCQQQLPGACCSSESRPVTRDCSDLPKSRKGRSSSPGVQTWFFNPFRSKSSSKSKLNGDVGSNGKNMSSTTTVAAGPINVDPPKRMKTPTKKSPWRIFHVIMGKSSKKNSGPPIAAVAPVSDIRAGQSHRFASTRLEASNRFEASTRFDASTNSPRPSVGLETQTQQQHHQHRKSTSNLPVGSEAGLEAGSYAGPPLHGCIPEAQAMNGYEWASTPGHRLSVSNTQDGISTPSHRFVPVESGVEVNGRLSKSGEATSFHRLDRLMLLEHQLQAGGNAEATMCLSLPRSFSSHRNSLQMGSNETSGCSTPAHSRLSRMESTPAHHRLSQMESANPSTPSRRSVRLEHQCHAVAGVVSHGMNSEDSNGGATPAHRSGSCSDYSSTPSHHLHHAAGTPLHRKICVNVAGDGTPIHRNAYFLPPVPNAFSATHTKEVQNLHNDIDLRRG